MSNKGTRVAQLILEKIITPAVEELSALDDTSRGAAGFRSTGMQFGPTKNFGISSVILSSTNKEQSISVKSKTQDPVRIIFLKRLEGSNKQHVIRQTTGPRQRCFLSVRPVNKLR